MKIARAYSGRLDSIAPANRAVTSAGDGTVGSMFGIAGGFAHCAGFESRHPHLHACVNIEDKQAWIWYTVREREPPGLVGAVQVGQHLRRHLATGFAPSVASMLRW